MYFEGSIQVRGLRFVDALVLGQVCFRIAFELVSNDMFSKDAEREYFSNYHAAKMDEKHA